MATVMPRRCVCQAQSLGQSLLAGVIRPRLTWLPVSTLPARHFSASPLAFVSQAKIKARQRIKAKRSQKEAQQKDFERHRPDPILGYPVQIPDGHAAWEGCELKKLIVSREDVWSGKAAEATGARLLNFGLKDGHATFLFEALPDVSAQRVVLGEGSVFDEGAGAKIEEASAAEQRKRQTLEKILDMRNADSKAIERFNIGRIVDVFSKHQDSRHELDPGCPEVQGALLARRAYRELTGRQRRC